MNRFRRWRVPLLLTACCIGLFGYWAFHQCLHANPERIHSHYSRELNKYGARLAGGDVRHDAYGYAIPQFLIDKGAKSVTQHGRCYAIWFSSFLDNPTPVLWFSPNGFDPMPPELAKVAGEPQARWQQLSPTWSACELPWWVTP